MNTLYIRIAKKVDNTVFQVVDGQKKYWDPTFNKPLPYSSGQQVKRCIIEEIANSGNFQLAPTTFEVKIDKEKKSKDGQGGVLTACDPTFVDQLLGGYMNITGKSNVKRRSPLSISAMRPIHPKLANIDKTKGSFDRRGRDNNIVRFIDSKTKEEIDINDAIIDEVLDSLEGAQKNFHTQFLPDLQQSTGIFVFDMAIDLNRLFTVKYDILETEITDEIRDKLIENGWDQVGNLFTLSAEKREMLIPHIVDGILNWRITSNQSRNFSMMEILAVATSTNVHEVSGAIRAELDQDEHAQLVLSDDAFITESAGAYSNSFNASPTAINDARSKIIELLSKHNPAQEKVTL
ncbi:hypothetical protein [Flammeovirga sp. OC4]|uniref:hypothetical protein n=1 Tax=Flammeovirga sp. OC4 TaxID=1382345 RepID=UPI0005C76814|nr:hypothetical protein [Flammeovirga sp. OC4]